MDILITNTHRYYLWYYIIANNTHIAVTNSRVSFLALKVSRLNY